MKRIGNILIIATSAIMFFTFLTLLIQDNDYSTFSLVAPMGIMTSAFMFSLINIFKTSMKWTIVSGSVAFAASIVGIWANFEVGSSLWQSFFNDGNIEGTKDWILFLGNPILIAAAVLVIFKLVTNNEMD